MTVTLLQTDIQWASPSANRTAVEELMKGALPSDIYILPEMFTTGFATEPEGIAESCDSTLCWMQTMAGTYDAAIVGSVALNTNEGYRNRLYFVKPDGEVAFYDKHHLFTYGHEDRHYTPGNERTIVEWRGMKFLLQVCYDLRFPIFSRNVMVNDEAAYDAVIYVANWPESRRRVWDALLIARAIENQCYVVGVNRVGDDILCHYNGGTTIIDAYGKVVAKADDNTHQTLTASLDIPRLAAFRTKFPVLNDADACPFA